MAPGGTLIGLAEQRAEALGARGKWPVGAVDPRTGERYLLLRKIEYIGLVDDGYDYDDGEWTEEERLALNWQMCERLERDEAIKYDYPEDGMPRGDVVLVRFPHPKGLGSLPPPLMQQLDACLKVALDLRRPGRISVARIGNPS